MKDALALLAFLSRISQRQRRASLILLCVVATGIVGGVGNAVLIAFVNRAIRAASAVATHADIIAFAALCALVALSRFASQYLLARLAAQAVYQLRIRFSEQIIGAPLRALEEIGPSRLLAHLTDDVGAISEAVVQLPVLVFNLAIIAGCLVYLGVLSPTLLAFTMGVIGVGIVTYQGPMRRSTRHFHDARRFWDELISGFHGLTHGIKELKLHAARRERFAQHQVERPAGNIRNAALRGYATLAAANSWGQVLFFAVLGAVLFGASHVRSLDAAVATGYALALLFMVSPIEVVLQAAPTLGRARVAFEQLERLTTQLPAPAAIPALPPKAGEPGRLRPLDRWREIRLEGITHAFRGESDDRGFVLGPIDLRIVPGEITFIVGGNGSGKTTLAKLVCGLYRPERGRVLLDGELIDESNIEHYRSYFSAIFSDFYLFKSLLGIERADLDAEARTYLELLRLSHKLTINDGVLSTVDLSQGQRKRLALLTAYLEDRPIYLFDEWSADQDPAFRDVFYHQLLPALRARGKGVVVITHDDRYFGVADRLIEVEYGQLKPARTSIKGAVQ